MKQDRSAAGKHRARPAATSHWSVPVALADVPETGRQVALVADEATRAAVAQATSLAALPRLAADFELTRHGQDGLRVLGRVSATIGQNCVVTLEPLQAEVDESVDLLFMPEGGTPRDVHSVAEDDPPEVLHDGLIDLGALAVEFLILGIDPYPRKPGAEFDSPRTGDPAAHPFAALAALKKDQGAKGP